LSSELLTRFLSEQEKQASGRSAVDYEKASAYIRKSCFPKQAGFVNDDTQYIAAIVPRGCGKTTAARARLLLRMFREPKANCVFVTISRTLAEQLLWLQLKETVEKLGLGGSFNETKLTYTMPNGSRLRLLGADDKKEVQKLRGQTFSEVVLDECAFFPPSLLQELIEQVIEPRLASTGRLVLIGTPSAEAAGPFYEVTRPGSTLVAAEGGKWTVHSWLHEDGAPYIPYIADSWSDEHAVWRREYRAEWARDFTERIYKYRPHTEDGQPCNQWDPKRVAGYAELPKGLEWNYVFGMDMGHSDPFALQVVAFSFGDPSKTLYHVYEFQRRGMYARTIAEQLLGPGLSTDTPGGLIGALGWPVAMVADTTHLGGALLDELSNVYGIHVEKAEQKNKHDAIELTNGDLLDGRIKILKGSILEQQMMNLQWQVDPDSGQLKERKGDRNDCADAFVYARRKAMHLFGEEAPKPTKQQEQLRQQLAVEEYVAPGEFDDFVGGSDFSSILG
jgi:hypothetical protein